MSDAEQAEIGTHVATVPEEGEVSVPEGPVDMARIVGLAESGVEPEAVGKLIDLYERVHGIQARQAYNRAMLAIQQHMDAHPVRSRGKVVVSKNGTTRPYVLLEDIQRALAPICAEHGISYGFDTEATGKGFTVTLRIRHVTGHSETVKTTLPLDDSGSKNKVQGVGSTESYGMRYGLIKGFGLARYLHDDDGAGAADVEVETVGDEQLANLKAVWDEVKGNVDEGKFYAHYKIEALSEMPASKYQQALEQLERRRS